MEIRNSVRIEAPPEAVFDFVCELERIPEYVPFVHRVYELSPGPVGTGTTYKELAKPPGAPFASVESWTCTRFERPVLQQYEGQARDMAAVLTKHFEPQDGGTRYSQTLVIRLLPRVRPLGWLLERTFVERRLASVMDGVVQHIKEIIEAEAAAASSDRAE